MRINFFFIWDDTFDCIRFNFVNILNIFYEINIVNFLGVDASCIFFTENICKFFVSDKVEIVQNSDELVSRDEVRFRPIVVLKGIFKENSFAGDRPFDVIEELIQSFLITLIFSCERVVEFEGLQIRFRKLSVTKLLINCGNKV